MTAQIRDFLINHIVDRLTEYLVLDNNIDITAALKIVYESKIYQQLQDIEGDFILKVLHTYTNC